MTDVQTICLTAVIVALCAVRCFELLMQPIKQAIKEFDLDEVHVVGRTVNIKAKE